MRLAAILLCLGLMTVAAAFDPPVDTAGKLTATILGPSRLETLDPFEITVALDNAADAPATGTVRIDLTDDWKASPAERTFTAPAAGKAAVKFTVTPSPRSYAAHYPVHAYVDFRCGGRRLSAHPILILEVSSKAGYVEPWATPPPEPVAVAPGAVVALERTRQWTLSYQTHDQPPITRPRGWLGADHELGCYSAVRPVDRGGVKQAIWLHEPWKKGWGTAWLDFPLVLPKAPCKLVFWTAIRDHNPEREPPSDGVEFRVYAAPAGSADFKELFRRFSAAKRWEKAEVDLSPYAGQRITLRLWQGPGPKNDTTCDQAFWGEPTVVAGDIPVGAQPSPSPDVRSRALAMARAALRGDRRAYSWTLRSRAGRFGAAIGLGSLGILDGALAFASDRAAVVFDGFRIFVDESRIGGWRSEIAVRKVSVASRDGQLTVTYHLADAKRSFRAQVRIWAERGGLRFAFSMPGVRRARDGTPRFTELSLGRASQPVRRLYCGFGNVMVPSGPVTVRAGGFGLSTRHVGADFTGGLSLLQASDIFPDRFEWRPDEQRCSLVVHHDATITLVPSDRGSFTAARVFREIAAYKPSPGYKNIVGRMCIDRWGGPYADDAAGLRRAAAYGLTDAVFVKHVWQRWGYDYRLPDIYPPGEYAGSREDFMAMVQAAKQAGMLFAVHDNYIDFYPDATGFSYRHIIFNPDGQPQRAWFNRGRKAQSYRWLPGAFMPWLERNLKLIRDGFAPTAYFIDVFSAMPPIDYFDQSGRFYTKKRCADAWGRAFDRVRQILGGQAPTISEAGHDGLIGHLDAGEADHYEASRWSPNLADHERVPWHDMVSHGSFVLLAGGLGHRYSNNRPGHGYGSDDYFSNTVIGGRNPMCNGPGYRNTIITYWLLHDVCARLARASLETVEFVGDDIHRLHSTFSDGSQVWVNRGHTPWKVGELTLPQYGFIALAGPYTAQIALRDGIPARMASSPGVLFVDARAPALDIFGRAKVVTHVTGGRIQGDTVVIDVVWEILQPLPEGEDIFVHLCHPSSSQGEKIASFGRCDLPREKLQQPGKYAARIIWKVPEDAPEGTWFVRYGLWNRRLGGRRTIPVAPMDGSRVIGGDVVVRKVNGRSMPVKYIPGPQRPGGNVPNPQAKMVDFGPVATNAAFRLLYSGDQWLLIPAPGNLQFRATLRLDRLGAAGRKVAAVIPEDMHGRRWPEKVKFSQRGNDLEIVASQPGAFRYRIIFAAR